MILQLKHFVHNKYYFNSLNYEKTENKAMKTHHLKQKKTTILMPSKIIYHFVHIYHNIIMNLHECQPLQPLLTHCRSYVRFYSP